MRSGGRRIVRNPRFRLIGAGSLLLAAGAVGLGWVVLTSPGYGLDHPGGFTPAGRVVATIGCAIPGVAFAAIGIGGLRVALILDDTGLVIRNPFRTTAVEWTAKPRFEIRSRRQDVSVTSPNAVGAPRPEARLTYRYREITCTVRGKRLWIAATSRMRNGPRVDELLRELREAAGRFRDEPVSPDRHRP